MTCNKICIRGGSFSEIQSKIILMRGFTPEENLLYQKDFAQQLKRPLTTINYNIQQLKKKGIFTDLNNLTPDGKLVLRKLKGYLNNTKKIRGHKLFGKFILREPYRDFESIKNKYLRISKSPKHRGFKLEFKDCVVLFYSPQKICFYLPEVFGDSIEEIYAEAYEQYINPLKNYLEQMFNSLKINEYEIASVTINHLALQNNSLAEIFKEFNVQYKSDRLEVDHSHGVAELETVHKKHSVRDLDMILDYEKLVRGSFNCNNENNKK